MTGKELAMTDNPNERFITRLPPRDAEWLTRELARWERADDKDRQRRQVAEWEEQR